MPLIWKEKRRPSAAGLDLREGLVTLVGTKQKAKCPWSGTKRLTMPLVGRKRRPSASGWAETEGLVPLVGTIEKA